MRGTGSSNFTPSFQTQTPKSIGLTSVASYVLVCILFVCLALLEFAIVLAIKRYREHKERAYRRVMAENDDGEVEDQDGRVYEQRNNSGSIRLRRDSRKGSDKRHEEPKWRKRDPDNIAFWLDRISLVILPIAFVVFDIVYTLKHI